MFPLPLLLLPLAPLQDPGQTVTVERRLAAMGTHLGITVEARDRATALLAGERAARAIELAEDRLSTWRDDSELARLNRAPVGEPFDMSGELARELQVAQGWFRETGGAFDPSVGGLVEAWDLRGSGRVPSDDEIAAARVPTGFGALELDGRAAVRRAQGLRIEEGGFGKGAGLDAALAAVAGDGVFGAVLDLGGQVALAGGGSVSWSVADPRDRGRPVVSFLLGRGSVATSGNSERGIVVGGEEPLSIGHLLDPRTGRPAPDFGSLTVWARDAETADCLSTGLYVLGPDAALEWARGRDDVEVLVLEVQDDLLIARATDGWAELALLAGDVVLERSGGTAAAALAAGALAAAALQDPGAETTDQRVDELERRIDVVAEDLERQDLGSIVPPVGESFHGMGPAASKVYGVEQGVSIGGYGELVYSNPETGTATADFLRAVLYFGYRFDEKWLLNTEFEFEHASTSASGAVSVEFAYLDYLAREEINGRVGLVLLPMGIYNELHEPSTFYPSLRPGVEGVIIPSTWRESGAGAFGDLGAFNYRAYVVNGLDGAGFDATGLRGGRQKGSKAKAEDLAFVGRADWNGVPGITLGGSYYYGDSGQDAGVDVPTSIFDVHLMAQWRAWQLRGLYALASLDNVDDLNNNLGLTGAESIGERLEGYYVELGYDVLGALRPETGQGLTPFLRWEQYDTQAQVPAGFAADPANDVDILTYGIAWQPNSQIIFKLDYMNVDNGAGTGSNRLNIAMGYVF